MIEVGKTYKLKKIKDFFGTNTENEYKVLEIKGDLVHCKDLETNEHYVLEKKYFIDPEFPEDIYSDLKIVWEKLDKVIKDNKAKTWKEIKECEGSAGTVAGTNASSLGTAPTPAVGQVQNTTVNGIPVFGKSIKRKRNKRSKNENAQWLPHGPESAFHDADDKEIEFEDAINLIRYGQTEDELDEYKEYLDLFARHNCQKQFLEYAYKEYGLSLFDLSPNAFGLREEAIMEKPLFLKFKHATKAFEEGRISFEEYDKILNEYKDVFNKLVFGIDKNQYESTNKRKFTNKKINEKRKRSIIEPKKKIILDDMEDETGLNIQENRLKKLNKKISYFLEAINNDSIIGIDETIINWLDDHNFENSQTKEGFLYYYEGNYEHIFFYSKDYNNPTIRYQVKNNNETIYNNIWFITFIISIKDILNQITNIFNRFE